MPSTVKSSSVGSSSRISSSHRSTWSRSRVLPALISRTVDEISLDVKSPTPVLFLLQATLTKDSLRREEETTLPLPDIRLNRLLAAEHVDRLAAERRRPR